eukprot:scaffold56550_cov69-Phaeocystis_antarctica.AAC.3
MAMSLPRGTYRAPVHRMRSQATLCGSISVRRPVDAIVDKFLRRGAEEVAELATALFLVVLVHHDNLQAGLERSCSSHVAFEHLALLDPRVLVEVQQHRHRFPVLFERLHVWHRVHNANRSAIARRRGHQLFGDFGRARVPSAAPQDEELWQGKLGGIHLTVLNEDEVLWRVACRKSFRERAAEPWAIAKNLGGNEFESEVLEVVNAVPSNRRAPVEDRLAHLVVAALRL